MAKSLNEQAQEIIRIAEESGVQSNFFFVTTFKRYQVQLNNLTRVEKALQEDKRPTVDKSYVKGRENMMINPLIAQYDKGTDSANKTVATLLRIIRNFGVRDEDENKERDDLMAAINGGDDYEEAD